MLQQGPVSFGSAGKDFTLKPPQPSYHKVQNLRVFTKDQGSTIAGLEVVYTNIRSGHIFHPERTGEACSEVVDIINEDLNQRPASEWNYVTSISGTWETGSEKAGTRITSLVFQRSDGEKVSVGRESGKPFVFEVPRGWDIFGFFGKATDDQLSQLGILTNLRTDRLLVEIGKTDYPSIRIEVQGLNKANPKLEAYRSSLGGGQVSEECSEDRKTIKVPTSVGKFWVEVERNNVDLLYPEPLTSKVVLAGEEKKAVTVDFYFGDPEKSAQITMDMEQ